MESTVFSEKVKSLRLQLKSFAITIREKKDTRKSVPDGYVIGLDGMRFDYRVYHIIYCLLRGRSLAQIESNRLTNPPDSSGYNEIYLRMMVKKNWLELVGTELPDIWTEVNHAAVCPRPE